ncbi:MAG: hypothetical protein U5L96_06160 [Owenweeksia sp.]|nr:hypothetical protein [Owenweeksia sp.]
MEGHFLPGHCHLLVKASGDVKKIQDDDYLSGITRKLVSRILAVPPHLAHEVDSQLFYDKTWIHLLSQKRLVFFSVWSPSFLIRLLRHLHQRKAEILRLSAELAQK